MRRLLRIVIALVLAAALPLQGIAATLGVGCSAALMTAASTAPAPAAARAAQQHPAHHADADAPCETVQHASHGAHGVNAKSAKAKAKAKCSACAACCVGAVMAMSWFTVARIDLTQAFSATAPQALAVFLTAGLERPPRNTAA